MKVRICGDTAVVTGRFFGRGRYKGNPIDKRQRFTSLWFETKPAVRSIIASQGSTLNNSRDSGTRDQTRTIGGHRERATKVNVRYAAPP